MKVFDWKSLLKRWSELLMKGEKIDGVCNEEKPTRSTQRLKNFLDKRFDFRYNRLTGVTEYRAKGAVGQPFRSIDEREMNGLIVDARLAAFRVGIAKSRHWCYPIRLKVSTLSTCIWPSCRSGTVPTG